MSICINNLKCIHASATDIVFWGCIPVKHGWLKTHLLYSLATLNWKYSHDILRAWQRGGDPKENRTGEKTTSEILKSGNGWLVGDIAYLKRKRVAKDCRKVVLECQLNDWTEPQELPGFGDPGGSKKRWVHWTNKIAESLSLYQLHELSDWSCSFLHHKSHRSILWRSWSRYSGTLSTAEGMLWTESCITTTFIWWSLIFHVIVFVGGAFGR